MRWIDSYHNILTDRLFFVKTLAFTVIVLAVLLCQAGYARQRVVMTVTGEDLGAEVRSFNRGQSIYEVIVNQKNYTNWRQAANRFRLAQEDAGQGRADIVFVDNNWLPALIKDGNLGDLTEHIPDAHRFVPGLLDVATQNGRIYAVPFSTKGLVLFYRKDFHDRHHLAIPESLGELAANCRVLIEKEKLDHGVTLHYSAIHLDVLPLIWSNGGDVIKDGKGALSRPETVAVMTDLRNLVRDRVLPGTKAFDTLKESYRNALDVFTRGQSAYLVSWNNRLTDLASSPLKGNVGVTHIPPYRKGQAHYSVAGSWYFAVNGSSANQAGARAFLNHICSDSVQKEMARQRPGFLSVLVDNTVDQGTDPDRDIKAALTPLRHRLKHPRETDIAFVFDNAVRQILVEGKPVDDILRLADRRITAILEE